jgi:imidazolonepropionase-like amidohydrolase
MDESDIRGEYNTYIDGLGDSKLIIGGKPGSYDVTISTASDTSKTKVKFTRNGHLINLSFNPKGSEGSTRITGYVSLQKPQQLRGELVKPNGDSYDWTANFTNPHNQLAKKETPKKEFSVGKLIYPFVSYGYESAPRAETVLVKNATVWTNESEGIVTETDLLIENGKIKAIGKGLNFGSAKVIDATGKHLTPGIIDEHSHIALQGVNEGSQSVTSEVRMGDVLNSEDINIYRQLAGGVTTSQLLHGSANAIGGQSQLIKLRWGKSPEELKFGGNDGFIKFALGENVKQSNWGDAGGSRFPQTRMGVEQVFIDAFTRAKEYKAAKNTKGKLVRKDLELDALVEILDEQRFITAHSYVQSEINMLISVADSMGFKVNTLTHILEGYKLADKMAERGIAASTFADWWAYKMEVAEAIPYNAYLMHSQGVVTAINSDDAEMARRLNQEAAKIVKYGGLSEEEAFKMVTLNPAKMLHIDDRVGSIKVGKDADFVIWNNNPLSIYAKAEKTFVDGIKYWDLDEDANRQKELEVERARLIQKSLDSKGQGNVTQRPASRPSMLYNCETMEEVEFGYFVN